MNKYTYKKHKFEIWGPSPEHTLVTQLGTVYECLAENITAADKLYHQKFGKDASKQLDISCSIVFDVRE